MAAAGDQRRPYPASLRQRQLPAWAPGCRYDSVVGPWLRRAAGAHMAQGMPCMPDELLQVRLLSILICQVRLYLSQGSHGTKRRLREW